MQAMPDARQQSFEEIYGPPENFLEIEVSVFPCHIFVGSYQLLPGDLLRLTLHPHPPGQESPDPWHITQHVHRLRNRLPHQHSCF